MTNYFAAIIAICFFILAIASSEICFNLILHLFTKQKRDNKDIGYWFELTENLFALFVIPTFINTLKTPSIFNLALLIVFLSLFAILHRINYIGDCAFKLNERSKTYLVLRFLSYICGIVLLVCAICGFVFLAWLIHKLMH